MTRYVQPFGRKVFIAAILASTGLHGRAASAAVAGEEQPSISSGIQDIIVTARKREESIQRVPVSVAVQSGENLQQRQVTDIISLQAATPSLVVASTGPGYAASNFAIRGVGTAITGPQVESSVGLVVDDIPMARSAFYPLELFDLDRVETLRGPQGMLFGKNATAGLINIVTGTPRLGESEVIGRIDLRQMDVLGNGFREKINLAANIPLSNEAALRVSGYFSHDDALMKNAFNPKQDLGKDQAGIRAKLLVEPTDGFRVTIAGDYTHGRGTGEAVFSYLIAPVGSLVRAQLTALGITPGEGNLYTAPNNRMGITSNIGGVSVKTELDFGSGYTLTNVLGYRRAEITTYGDADGLPISVLDNANSKGTISTQEQFSEELRISSPAQRALTFQGGLFFQSFEYRSAAEAHSYIGMQVPGTGPTSGPPPVLTLTQAGCLLGAFNVPGASTPCSVALLGGFPGGAPSHTQTDISNDSKSYAAFFEGQYRFSEKFSISAGGRYTRDRMGYAYSVTNYPDAIAGFYPGGFQVRNKASANDFSYRGSLNFQASHDILIYGSYGRGYKGPAFDTQTAAEIKPEISKTFELGLKSVLFDRVLRLNAAIFHSNYSDFQTQAPALDPKSGNQTIKQTNAGKLTTQGFDIDLTLAPAKGLTFNGAVSYVDSKYKNLLVGCYPGEPMQITAFSTTPGPGICFNPNFKPGLPVSATNPPGGAFFNGGVTNVDGAPLAFSPKWSFNLNSRYEFPVSDRLNLFGQADASYRSEYNFVTAADPNTAVHGFWLINLSAGARSEGGRWGVTVFVRNLANKHVPLYRYFVGTSVLLGDAAFGRGTSYVQQFSPDSFRQYGLSVDFKF